MTAVLYRIRGWITGIKAIVTTDPDRTWRMHSAACRVCASITVPTFDRDGNPIRVPALVVYSEGGIINRVVCDFCGSVLSDRDLAKMVNEQAQPRDRMTA
jgi:hypothetical protein